MTTDGTKTALVIGAGGGFGGEMARTLLRRGWRVRALARHLETARQRFGASGETIGWIAGDAMDAAAVMAAAEGADLIVHGANPPGYRNWRGLALPMLENTIAAAERYGARILFPGTIYNYGPDAFPVLAETSPQHPRTRKGAIRVEMERRLGNTCAKVLILRAGDFFGPQTGSSWFSQGLIAPGRPLKAMTYPGPRRIGHSWAYLPDLAETAARLLDRAGDLADHDCFHVAGHHLNGIDMAQAIGRAAGCRDLPIRRFPWPLLHLGAPFVTFFREMIEMRYLWRVPLRLDNAKLVGFLGAEPHTPLAEAVAAALPEAARHPV